MFRFIQGQVPTIVPPHHDSHPVTLRLIRRSDPAITDVTVVHDGSTDRLASPWVGAPCGPGHRDRYGAVALAPNRERESLAFAIMVDELSRNPGNLLQRLVEVVTGVCGVGTAAVAMTDGNALGWDAAAGPLANSPRLAALRRVGAAGRGVDDPRRLTAGITREPSAVSFPSVVDTQAIPLLHEGSLVGVLWMANQHGRGITIDDERIVGALAQLASSAWTIWARGEATRHASDRKSELLALVSHELRNPLNTIATAATILHDGGPGGASATDAVDIITRQCRFMSRVVDDLFDTARLDHRTLDLQLASIDVRAVVVEALASRRQQVERHGHSLSMDLGDEPLRIDADPVRLTQILSNLVDNAIKYTPRGGRIVVSLRRTAGDIRLIVTDTGDGLPADQLTGIFAPFAQLESWTRTGGGLGLGLPLARRLAELHGGTLLATSPGLGQGSSFVVTLPAAAGQPTTT